MRSRLIAILVFIVTIYSLMLFGIGGCKDRIVTDQTNRFVVVDGKINMDTSITVVLDTTTNSHYLIVRGGHGVAVCLMAERKINAL